MADVKITQPCNKLELCLSGSIKFREQSRICCLSPTYSTFGTMRSQDVFTTPLIASNVQSLIGSQMSESQKNDMRSLGSGLETILQQHARTLVEDY